MAATHGKGAYLSVTGVGHADNSTALAPYLTSIDFGDVEGDVAEITTMGDSWREFIAGLKNATCSVEGIHDTVPGTLLPTLVAGTAAPFRYGPAGTANGAPKLTGSWICTGYSAPADLNDAVTFGASFQVSGAITIGTWSSGA
jgi:predicted secreted protein